jgi:hypothetical protein
MNAFSAVEAFLLRFVSLGFTPSETLGDAKAGTRAQV